MGDIPEQVVFDWVVERAKDWLNPKTIVLYGSRARRDQHDRSDYDFAFELDELSRPNGVARLHFEAERGRRPDPTSDGFARPPRPDQRPTPGEHPAGRAGVV
jgi:predicted nucleotidyltransferase